MDEDKTHVAFGKLIPHFISKVIRILFKHSTTHAVLDVTHCLFDNINDSMFSCLAMLDLRKAFDTVSQKRFFLELEHNGIKETALALLEILFNKPYTIRSIDNFSSSLKETSVGVPLGSILGPLLYIIM